MKRLITIILTCLLLWLDIMVVNAYISKIFSKFFDLFIIFSPLVYLIIYIKPLLIMHVLNKIFHSSNRSKIINIWISLILFVLSAVVYSNKVLLVEGDVLFFELWIYVFVGVVSAIVLTYCYWKEA